MGKRKNPKPFKKTTKHRAGYKHWDGPQPKQLKAKSKQMTEKMRRDIAVRISAAKGWSVDWLMSLSDSELKRIAQNHL
jgi:hypothetical protein